MISYTLEEFFDEKIDINNIKVYPLFEDDFQILKKYTDYKDVVEYLKNHKVVMYAFVSGRVNLTKQGKWVYKNILNLDCLLAHDILLINRTNNIPIIESLHSCLRRVEQISKHCGGDFIISRI